MENPEIGYNPISSFKMSAWEARGLAPALKVPSSYLLNIMRSTPADNIQIALVRAQSKLTLGEAMAQPSQLSLLRKDNPIVAEMVVATLVELVADQFNVKETFSDIQIVDCTLSIIEKFWYLRPEEIMYAFKQAKLGKYGPVYNRLDASTILTWLHKYDTEERLTQVDNVRDNYKKAEMQSQVDIHAEYVKELAAQKENGGTPTLVIRDKETRARKLEKQRGELEFQRFQEEYFKSKNSKN